MKKRKTGRNTEISVISCADIMNFKYNEMFFKSLRLAILCINEINLKIVLPKCSLRTKWWIMKDWDRLKKKNKIESKLKWTLYNFKLQRWNSILKTFKFYFNNIGVNLNSLLVWKLPNLGDVYIYVCMNISSTIKNLIVNNNNHLNLRYQDAYKTCYQ